MTINLIEVVSVPVSDQDRAKAFYVDLLGFEARNDAPFGDGQRWVEVAPPGAATSLALVTWMAASPPGSAAGLVLACDAIEAAVADLAARGVSFQGPAFETPWGRFATFADPDGNTLMLHQG